MEQYDLIVVGGGISGMTAILGALKSGPIKALLIEREEGLGGILNQCIHNGFGKKLLGVEVTGPEYVNLIRNKLKSFNIDIKLNTQVLDISQEKVVTFVNPSEGVKDVKGACLILAMGCREKYTGSIDIPTNSFTGIYTIGNAHRIVNLEGYLPGREPVLVVNNKWALIVARRLVIEGARIKAMLIEESDDFIFNESMQEIVEGFNIPIFKDYKVVKIFGKCRVDGVKIYSKEEKKNLSLKCDSLLLSVGYFPEENLLRKLNIELDKSTLRPKVDNFETEISGIFACGNLIYGVKALKEKDVNGYQCGEEAYKYIINLKS